MSSNLQGLEMKFLHDNKQKIFVEEKKCCCLSNCLPRHVVSKSTTVKKKTLSDFMFLVAANRELYWDVDREYFEYMSE